MLGPKILSAGGGVWGNTSLLEGVLGKHHSSLKYGQFPLVEFVAESGVKWTNKIYFPHYCHITIISTVYSLITPEHNAESHTISHSLLNIQSMKHDTPYNLNTCTTSSPQQKTQTLQ